MVIVGWALLGAALGAAGTEFLRASNPELVKKVEDAARRFVAALSSSKSAGRQADDEADNAGADDAS